MKAFSAATVFVTATAAEAPLTNLALTWNDCGGVAKIDTVAPSTVPLGTATKITGSGTSPVKVTGGRFDATVKAGWIPLASCSGPLGPSKVCTLPLGAGSLTLDAIPLPIGPGPASISLTVELSANLPAQLASTTTHATALNEGNQKMVCIDVHLKAGMKDEITTVPVTSGNLIDDILKLVCGLMKNGDNEVAAEAIICGHMDPLLVGVCKELVKLDWGIYSELAKCNADGHSEVAADKILDDLMKLVCQVMKNGSSEAEAQKVICSHFKNDLETQGCNKVVDLVWNTFEHKECPAEAKSFSVLV